MTLGVIFFILIIAGVYLYVADPFEIKPLVKSLVGQAVPTAQTTAATKQSGNTVVDKNPLLSPAQEQALEKVGIDPTTLPSKITPTMEQCFYSKLGTKRAEEIKGGAEPTAADYFVARSCL